MRTKSFLIALVALLLSTLVMAEEFEYHGVRYGVHPDYYSWTVLADNEAYVMENNYSGDVVIEGNVMFDGITYTVVGIGSCAFNNCPELTSITIPSSIRFIGDGNFRGCKKLNAVYISDISAWQKMIISKEYYDSDLEYPYETSNPLYWAHHLFLNGEEVKYLMIPDDVEDTGYNFEHCLSLTSVTVPDNVTSVGSFYGCQNIRRVNLGKSVKTIKSGAFSSYLSDITCLSQTPPNLDGYGVSMGCNWLSQATLHVESGNVEVYKNTEPWNDCLNIVGLDEYTVTFFIDKTRYKTAIYKPGDEIILEEPTKEGYTFSGWGEIPKIMPSESIIAKGSFTINKHKLTYMVDGEEYKSYDIEYGAQVLPLEEPAKEGYTFSGWSEIPENMPDNDVSVTGSFTINNYKLTYYVDGEAYKTETHNYDDEIVPEAEPTRKGMTFSGWNIGIPEKMPGKDIEVKGTFSWSKSTIDNVIYEVSDTTYNYCKAIGNESASGAIKIAEAVDFDYSYNVTIITDNLFNGCKDITSIEIPATVTTIGERAFASIDKLTDVTIYAEDVPETDRTAFENSYIEDYVTLHVPAASIDKYKEAAPWKNFKQIVGIAEPKKCDTPTITFADGKVKFACETEGVTFKYEIKNADNFEGEGDEIEVGGVYNVSVYAIKKGFIDSDKATTQIKLFAVKGDVNGDGKINVGDHVALTNIIMGIAEEETEQEETE